MIISCYKRTPLRSSENTGFVFIFLFCFPQSCTHQDLISRNVLDLAMRMFLTRKRYHQFVMWTELYWLQDRDSTHNWFAILQHFKLTMKPSDPLLLTDGSLRCRMYPADKNDISWQLAVPGLPRVTILSASSVWMLVHCVVKHSRPPYLKSSSNVMSASHLLVLQGPQPQETLALLALYCKGQWFKPQCRRVFTTKKVSGPSCICGSLDLGSVPIWCGLLKNMLWQCPEYSWVDTSCLMSYDSILSQWSRYVGEVLIK